MTTMKTDYEIRKSIMRRVWVLYILRQVSSPALRAGAFLGSVLILAQLVSVSDVVANALGASGLAGFGKLMYSALMTTETSVLTLTTLIVLLAGWFIVDEVRVVYSANGV